MPKKRDKTHGSFVRVRKEASREPWMKEDEDKGDADHVHLVRAADKSHSTPVLRAMIKQGTIRGMEIKCTPDTGATRTVVAADVFRRLWLPTPAVEAVPMVRVCRRYRTVPLEAFVKGHLRVVWRATTKIFNGCVKYILSIPFVKISVFSSIFDPSIYQFFLRPYTPPNSLF